MNIRRAARSVGSEAKDAQDDDTSRGMISLIMGIAGILLVLIPSMLCAAGIIGCIIGIILGISALKSKGKLMAIGGIVFSSLGIVIGMVNAVRAW